MPAATHLTCFKRSCAVALTVVATAAFASAQVPSPETHFGFRMGEDRRLAPADAIDRYFEVVAAQSDRVELVNLGSSTDGRRTIAALISSPENIRNLAAIQDVNRRLSDPRLLDPEEARTLASNHKVVLAIGAGIHASEVGPIQAANELLHSLATADDAATLAWLDQMVVVLIPTLNPDGYRLVTDWYQRQLGTPFEGGSMPWLYHKYAGHDINRDGFMMNLAENRNLARFFYQDWHPQVFLTLHQMGSEGPRFFVPPTTDPIDPNYDPLIWRTSTLLGSAMAFELQRDGKKGVISSAIYDYYWPGYEDSAPLGHNVVCLLAEVAGVKLATPITVNEADLRPGQNGLPDSAPRVAFPDPWPGGTWTLRNTVDYTLTAVRGLLRAVAAYRGELVSNFHDMARRAVETGSKGQPFAFIMPPEQRDPVSVARLQQLLIDGGVEVQTALEPFRADGDPYPQDSTIILLAQPYRAYVKTLLERQRYPGSPRDRPYDATGWSLPDQMGVDVRLIERTFEPPLTSRLTKAVIAPGRVWGERRPGFYVIDAPGNAGAMAISRLTAAGVRVSWLTTPLETGGYVYKPGSLIAMPSKQTDAALPALVAELGIRADGVRGKPPATIVPIGRARVAMYRPWIDTIDEGWTRWLLEQYAMTFSTITDADLHAGNLRASYDAIILPSSPADRLRMGLAAGSAPPEYTGGLGQAGVDQLKAFVEAGGTLICLDQSGQLAIEMFPLSLADATRTAGDRFYGPGSIVRVNVDNSHPLGFGLANETAGFFSSSAAYVSIDPARNGATATSMMRSIARYGDGNPLLSGWLEEPGVIAGRSAVVEVSVGTGRVVLLGFRVQHRGQSLATFRLLFNALYTSTQPPEPRAGR